MSFELVWIEEADKQYKAIRRAAETAAESRKKSGKTKSSKQEGLFKQVHKCAQLLAADPRHPGLATHEYDSLEHPYDQKKKVFEAYVQNKTPGAYRLFWCHGPLRHQVTVIAITPHP